MPETTNLTHYLEILEKKAQGNAISVGDIVVAFQQRGFGPLLLAPALIAFLPTGAIPGIPTVCALLICLINVQRLFGLSHPWVPERLRRVSINRKKFESALRKARPITKRIDRLMYSRYIWLIEPPAGLFIAAFTIVLALAMIPLEMIPFAAAIPSFSIALFALGLTANDGLLILFGLVATVIATISAIFWLF